MLCSTSVCGSSRHRHNLFTPGRSYRARVPSVRTKQSNTTVTAALGFFRKKIATAGAIDDLLAAIEGTGRGCTTSSSQRAKIDAAINVLEGAADRGNDFGTDLTATWKLLWTTEKVRSQLHPSPANLASTQHIHPHAMQETLFILRNAGLLRTTAGDVYQVRLFMQTL